MKIFNLWRKIKTFRLYVMTGKRLNEKLLKSYDDGRQKNHKLLHEAIARNAELEYKYDILKRQLQKKAAKK